MSTKCKILLVDDESFTLNATATVLRNAGHEVHLCEQWACVASTVRTHQPDLVLLDYNMPALTGDKICQILKRNVMNSAMQVYLYSSEPERSLIAIADECGADGYIRKDVPAPELVARVDKIVAERGQ
jgi:DNA-binding response OmpR family regulator